MVGDVDGDVDGEKVPLVGDLLEGGELQLVEGEEDGEAVPFSWEISWTDGR